MDEKLRIESRLAQIGSQEDPATGAVNYPIYNATAFRHPRLGQSTGFDYSRTKSPTRSVLEEAAAELESGDAGFACSSGMAALTTVFALFGHGDHLVVSLDLYGEHTGCLSGFCPSTGSAPPMWIQTILMRWKRHAFRIRRLYLLKPRPIR